ncbi:hypothetical protein F4808DRAFT_437770 [Astrocystis sublimbata]|nr:hypothetical protein F4808DRAFT_437770 [Astrocystis sublimbata]
MSDQPPAVAADTPQTSSTTNGTHEGSSPAVPRQVPVSTASPTASSFQGLLPSNTQAAAQASPPLHTAGGSSAIHNAVGPGPGPLRHPRPLTAAELHQQVEQEQELIVNRLSRDLTMLRRAQNSSVVSNASSTSASTSAVDLVNPASFTDSLLYGSPPFPVPTGRRHHRTSSSASTRSLGILANQGLSASTPAVSTSHAHSAGAAAILEAARNPRGPAGMSRQNSTTSHRSESRNRSPPPHHHVYGQGYSHGHMPSSHSLPYGGGGGGGESATATPGYFGRNRASSNASIAATPGSDLSPGLVPATPRYEETLHYRNELEAAKRENEALRKRVRALEKMLRETRVGEERERERSELSVGVVSSTAEAGSQTQSQSESVSVLDGVPTPEVKVGESAASKGTEVPKE